MWIHKSIMLSVLVSTGMYGFGSGDLQDLKALFHERMNEQIDDTSHEESRRQPTPHADHTCNKMIASVLVLGVWGWLQYGTLYCATSGECSR